MSDDETQRYRRGWDKLAELDRAAGQRLIDAMRLAVPDLARYAIEFPFGDVYQRPGLDLKTREIVNIAALTALGHALPQLRVHIHAALNVGVSREQISEILIQMAIYAGFPAALNAATVAGEVFRERDEQGIKS